MLWVSRDERDVGEDLQALTATANAQPAIMAMRGGISGVESVAGICDVVIIANDAAGHSLGEYSAHVIAGSFDLATAARLLRIRGNAAGRSGL